MLCPICKSMNVMRNGSIFTRDANSVFDCSSCGFSFIAKDGRFIRPSVRSRGEYVCFNCKHPEPLVMNVPAMVPRLGIYCPNCKNILCIWEGQEAELDFMPEFSAKNWVEGVENQEDPLKELVQNILCAVFLDAMPVDLKTSVEFISQSLERSPYVSTRILNRERRARAEAKKPKPKKKAKAKKIKKESKKKVKIKKKAKAVKKNKGNQKTTPAQKDETARQVARDNSNDTTKQKKSQE